MSIVQVLQNRIKVPATICSVACTCLLFVSASSLSVAAEKLKNESLHETPKAPLVFRLGEEKNELSDAEPYDPAEYRDPIIPPSRSELRGEQISGAASAWVELGPNPTEGAQLNVPPDNEVSGAIQAIAAHPSDADILYVGAVNGGIWKTLDATAPRPSWMPLTDNMPSSSIAALEFDPTDATRQTLLAGIGRLSNFARRGDDEIGVYRTTNGGSNWTLLGGNTLLGQRITGVMARGAVLYASSANGGLFKSTDTGANWVLVSGVNGLPTGIVFELISDPINISRFYISVGGATPRVLRSDDVGLNWTDITTGIAGLSGSTSHIRLSVGSGGVVFAAVVNSAVLAGVYRTADMGSNWTSLDVPSVHPGAQGTVNTSIAASPTDANVVYIGGDRITASPFTGNLVRINAAAGAGSQITTIMDGNAANTSPHADSRVMAFDANGNLLQGDDGGIYRRSNPTSSSGTWGSVIGNMNVMEVHDLDHDRVANIILIGTQDNGTHMQQQAANPRWFRINGGDGGDIAIDSVSQSGAGSYRYISSQNLGGFRRANYNGANTFVSSLTLNIAVIIDRQFVTPVEINIADSSRMLIGGLNNIYESNNINAASPVIALVGSPGANRNALANGAFASPNAAYVGRGSAVFRRVTTTFDATAALPAGANTITDVAMNPNNASQAFAVDDNQVFRTLDGGTTWTDITGNLPSISSADFRTIEFIPGGGADSIAIGSRSGVFIALANSNSWTLLGSGLPDVLVFDLRYLSNSRTLIAGTLGRGVWSHAFADANAIFSNGFEN